jgi:hypothetical protein
VDYVGIDWSYRRAAWCALSEGGGVVGEGAVPADEDGLARLVLKLGLDVRAVVEMMSGAIWVRDTLTAAGWEVQVGHARKVRDVAPLACKTDKVDARVLAATATPMPARPTTLKIRSAPGPGQSASKPTDVAHAIPPSAFQNRNRDACESTRLARKARVRGSPRRESGPTPGSGLAIGIAAMAPVGPNLDAFDMFAAVRTLRAPDV